MLLDIAEYQNVFDLLTKFDCKTIKFKVIIYIGKTNDTSLNLGLNLKINSNFMFSLQFSGFFFDNWVFYVKLWTVPYPSKQDYTNHLILHNLAIFNFTVVAE